MTAKPITFGTVLRYSLLPGVVPRIRELFGTGFGSFAYFVALVYRAVRLLPEGHPYLNPANIGQFGVVSVVAEAWRHITFNRRHLKHNNWDQIIAFVVVLGAIALLALQFITLALALFMPGAMAFSFPGGNSFATPFSMFDTPVVTGITLGEGKTQSFYDVSFMFLDRVFGVPDMFGSCIADGKANTCVAIGSMYGNDVAAPVNDPASFPWPYHIALQGMFQFYSIGLLVVAIFLLIYFAIVVIVETAQTGTPFGKRFDHVWAPLRLVAAAGLLIPISFGLNAGQYLVLYSAKWGANFASNGWIGFNQTLTSANVAAAQSTIMGEADKLIAKPNVPDPSELLHFIAVMNACRTIEDERLTPYARNTGKEYLGYESKDQVFVKPYLVRSAPKKGAPVFEELTAAMDYDYAVQFSQYGNVVIRFGIQDAYSAKDQKGTVAPVCGEITIPTAFYPGLSGEGTPAGVTPPAFYHEGATVVMRAYWNFLQEMILERGPSDTYNTIYSSDGATMVTSLPWNINAHISQSYVDIYYHPMTTVPVRPTDADYESLMLYSKNRINQAIITGLKKEMTNASGPYKLPPDLLVRGWAAAGIWYNRIAEMNGAFTTAAWNLPQVSMYPFTMSYLAQKKMEKQVSVSPNDLFSPSVGNTSVPIVFPRGPDEELATQIYWEITKFMKSKVTMTGNVVLDLINTLFGTSGLFSIRENANVHPLAQLSSIGKSLIERSVTLLGGGLLTTAISPWLTGDMSKLKPLVNVISSFAFSMLSIGASAGFILFFVLPLLPFIYFFFAVAGWVKTIFEAMVGVPLWALAHIRIDGKGLPGDAAGAGYFLILEIMVRPILIVFGLIASVTIYAASVNVLNDIFNLAVANVGGLDMDKAMTNNAFTMENLRSSIDTFFYTIMYVIIVYMLGMSSFKLIDLIPKSALRWLGSSATPFNDGGGEAASSQLVSYGTMGSQMAFSQLGGAARQGVQGLSELGKAMTNMNKKP